MYFPYQQAPGVTSPRSAEEKKVRSPGLEDRPTGGGHARGPLNPAVAVSVVDSSGTGMRLHVHLHTHMYM